MHNHLNALGQNNQVEDFRWAALVARALHPVDVQILEALGWIDEALSTIDLFQVFDGDVPGAVVERHLRRLLRLDAVAIAGTPSLRDSLDIPYCLAPSDDERRRAASQLDRELPGAAAI